MSGEDWMEEGAESALERHANASSGTSEPASEVAISQATEEIDEEAEEGILDVLADFQRAVSSMDAVMSRMTDGMSNLASDIDHGSARLQAIDWVNDPAGVERARQIARGLAGDMDLFSEILGSSVPALDESFKMMVTNLDLATSMAVRFGTEAVAEMTGNRPGLRELQGVVGQSVQQMASFVSILEGLPPVSREFGRARSRLMDQLQQLKYRLDSAHSDIGRTLDSLDALADE